MNTVARRRDVNITQATGAEFTEKGLGVMVVPVYLCTQGNGIYPLIHHTEYGVDVRVNLHFVFFRKVHIKSHFTQHTGEVTTYFEPQRLWRKNHSISTHVVSVQTYLTV